MRLSLKNEGKLFHKFDKINLTENDDIELSDKNTAETSNSNFTNEIFLDFSRCRKWKNKDPTLNAIQHDY